MKKTILGLGAVALILGVAGAVAGTASAFQGDPNVKGPNYSIERHEAMLKAFENKDYNAWKELAPRRGRITQAINESNFSQFAKMHELMLQGKTDEAQKIRQELGLGTRMGLGKIANGLGMGRGCNR